MEVSEPGVQSSSLPNKKLFKEVFYETTTVNIIVFSFIFYRMGAADAVCFNKLDERWR